MTSPGSPRKSRSAVHLGQKLEAGLRSYSIAAKAMAANWEAATLVASAAAMTGVLAAMAVPSAAEVVYTVADKALTVDGLGGFTYLNLDVNNDGQPDFRIGLARWYSFSSGHDAAFGWASAYGLVPANQVIQSSKGEWRAALPLGFRVGSSGKFQGDNLVRMDYCAGLYTQGRFITSGPWQNVTNRYLGLKFQIEGETHYGWARLNVTKGCDYTITLTGYAYETVANKPITAGWIPYTGTNPDAENRRSQPQSLGALAAGAALRARASRSQNGISEP